MTERKMQFFCRTRPDSPLFCFRLSLWNRSPRLIKLNSLHQPFRSFVFLFRFDELGKLAFFQGPFFFFIFLSFFLATGGRLVGREGQVARAFLLKIPRKTGKKMAAGGGRSIFTKFGEKMNAPPQRLVSFEYHFSLLAVVVVVVVVANFLSPYLRVCTSGVDGKVKVRV